MLHGVEDTIGRAMVVRSRSLRGIPNIDDDDDFLLTASHQYLNLQGLPLTQSSIGYILIHDSGRWDR